MDRDRVVTELRRYFGGRRDLVAAWLFGSVARGDARPGSDVDVAVLLTKTPTELADLAPIADIQADLEQLQQTNVAASSSSCSRATSTGTCCRSSSDTGAP